MITGVGQSENEERNISIGMKNGKAMSFFTDKISTLCIHVQDAHLCLVKRIENM